MHGWLVTCSKIFLHIVNTRWVCLLIHIWIAVSSSKIIPFWLVPRYQTSTIFSCYLNIISSVNFTTIRKTNLYRSKHLVNLNPNTDVLSTSVSFIRDGPFNFQGGGEGYVFFSKKIFWFPMFLKKYSDFGGGKKIYLIQSFCHIT